MHAFPVAFLIAFCGLLSADGFCVGTNVKCLFAAPENLSGILDVAPVALVPRLKVEVHLMRLGNVCFVWFSLFKIGNPT